MKGKAGILLVLGLFVAATTVVVAGPARRQVPIPAAAAPAAAAGGEWIDFTLEKAGGGTVSLKEFAGRTPVLLFFWATWCPHCKEAVPVVNRLQGEKVAAGRLRVLALDFMESREKVDAYVRARGVAYPVLLDENGSVARLYGVLGIPTYIVIGREGRIVYRAHELPPDIERYL